MNRPQTLQVLLLVYSLLYKLMTHFEAFFCQANIWEIEKKRKKKEDLRFKDRNFTFLKKRNLWFTDEDAKIQKAKKEINNIMERKLIANNYK